MPCRQLAVASGTQLAQKLLAPTKCLLKSINEHGYKHLQESKYLGQEDVLSQKDSFTFLALPCAYGIFPQSLHSEFQLEFQLELQQKGPPTEWQWQSVSQKVFRHHTCCYKPESDSHASATVSASSLRIVISNPPGGIRGLYADCTGNWRVEKRHGPHAGRVAAALTERVEKDRAAQQLLKRLAGVVTELRAQLKVSAEGHDLMRSHSGSIELLKSQVQMKMNAQRELERQACIVAELKSQVRSCESSWRLEMSQQAGLLDDLRGHMGSSMQLLQQQQAQATKLDQAQAAIAQELKAQRRERGETLRRATLELALAELTHGRVDPAGPSAAHGLIDRTFRRKERQVSAQSSSSFLKELLETKTASGGRPCTLDDSVHSSSPVCPSEPLTVGSWTQESAASTRAVSEAGGVWGSGRCQIPKACSARGDLFNNLQNSTRFGIPCLEARLCGHDPRSSGGGQDQPTMSDVGKGKKPFLTAGLTAPSPAHTHRAILARGDFFNNMKAPGVSSRAHSARAGSLGSAKKKSMSRLELHLVYDAAMHLQHVPALAKL
ncbi:hypothetical protein WJX79_002821 [Trebouxia sp. C0005]